MRTINQLMSQHERVWFDIDSDYRDCFIAECSESGYRFKKSEPLTESNFSPYLALHPEDKTIRYISGAAWNTYFTNPDAFVFSYENCIRLPVNYRAYARGDREYVYNMDRKLVAPEDFNYTLVNLGPNALKYVLGQE